jgi:DNA polymerase-3 subunit gamma/tau
MSLYLKYRPDDFNLVKGNSEIITSLTTMLSKKDPPHSYFFFGPTGCGKTTLARIVATKLGCSLDSDEFTEVDSAYYRGIDDVREMRRISNYMPAVGDCRVWILDECHKITGDAQNALLKWLEDTPKHVYVILCTTDPDKVIPTIKGRCQQFGLKPLSDSQMFGLLRRIVKEEDETVEKEVLDQIVEDSKGHARNAIQTLEQVLSVPEDKRLEIAKQSVREMSLAIDLCRALINKGSSWKQINTILKGLNNEDPERIRRAVIGYCTSVLLKGDNILCGLILEEFLDHPFYDSPMPQLVFACYNVINNR